MDYKYRETYGTKVQFTPGVELTFPDFVLIYRRMDALERYTREQDGNEISSWEIYYFSLAHKPYQSWDVLTSLSWSYTGLGEIIPTRFEFEGKHFLLELKDSSLGNLRDDGLVVSKI
jgi:hypothetical protein